ncbi:dicarboxylate/amino acid:cation symporter, partial [Francisella tularensis]|nr:dicarboxylate/amino acid:cation symporter [Francisella tularensis]
MAILLIISILMLVYLNLKKNSFNCRTILALIIVVVIGIIYNKTVYYSNSFIQISNIF